MAVDKLVDSTQLDADLTSVANAIRTKGGTSAGLMFPSGFVDAIRSIPVSASGLNYTVRTINRTYGNTTIEIDRDFDNFIFLAELKTFPPETLHNQYAYFCNCIYINDHYISNHKVRIVRQEFETSPKLQDFVGSPGKFNISETAIAWNTMDTNYSYVGDWIIVQIELPSSLGLYSLEKAVEDINAG